MADHTVRFEGRAGLQQRVLPAYRVPFFDLLSEACQDGLVLFAGEPRSGEAILSGSRPQKARLIKADNRHWLSGPLYVLRQPGLLEWLNEWRPDVLVLEANPRYLDNWRALSWARSHGRPVVGWGLGAPALKSGGPLLAWLWRRFLHQFDALIAYSSKGASEYQLASLPTERIATAINAVVENPPEPIERPPLEGRQLHLLFVGRLQPRKKVDQLLRACAELGADQIAVRIVGAGPDETRLKALADEVFPQAAFTGSQQGQPLYESFAWADLFVLPGTGGLAVQQAMAHGLPVVVAEGDGTQADLVRSDNGWLVRGDSTAALRQVLDQALQQRHRLAAMGHRSAEIVRHEINLTAMVRTFIDTFNLVAGEQG